MSDAESSSATSSSDNEQDESLTAQSNIKRKKYRDWTVDKAIYEIGCGRFQYYIFAITGIIWAADAMEMMLLAFLLPELQKDWKISGAESSLIGVSVFIGMLLGATSLAVLSDKYGRKKIITVGTLSTAIFGVLSGLAPNLGWMVLFRFGVGFFMTAGCVAYTLFAEFIPTEKDPYLKYKNSNLTNPNRLKGVMTRGKLLITQGVFWSAGALFSVFLAWITLKYLDWRWYLILSSVPLWFAFVGTFFMFESPHYLNISEKPGDREEAIKLIKRIADYNEVSLPSQWKLTTDNVKTRDERGQICVLFSDSEETKFRDTTVLLYIIYSCCVFSYYGISFISVRYFDMLDELYHLDTELYWEMTITTFAEVPALLLGILLIDKLGRRGVMNTAFLLFSISCYLLVVKQLQEIRILGIALVFIARMWINLGFIGLGIYFVEFYPTYIRATALGMAISLGRFAGIITTFTAESMSITLGLYLYGCGGLVAFIASILIQYDTTKKSIS